MKSHRLVRTVLFAAALALTCAIAALPVSPRDAAKASSRPAPQEQAAAPLPQAPPSQAVFLNVVSARTEPRAFGGTGVSEGAAVPNYKYILNIDNTGDPTQARDPGCAPGGTYPATCNWPSVRGMPSSSPIYTQGTEADFAAGLSLPAGKYLISVLADGYKLDGAHFTVPVPGSTVTVLLQPHPLPTATIWAKVFEDVSPTNGQPDLPAEHGLAGWVGHLSDYIGEVTTDIYGNPLCTAYERDGLGNIILNPPDYAPTPIPNTGGQCVSDANGDLIIPNLGTNRFAVSAVPPVPGWVQTTTLEGNHDWDTWVMEGNTGLDTEFVQAGEPFPITIFGFVRATNALPAGGTGTIKGVVDAVKVYVPAKGGLGLPGTIWGGLTGAKLAGPIDRPWIALSDLQNGDTAVWIGRGNADGSFNIPNVPDGNYTLTFWDEPQLYILDLLNISVANGEVVDMGVLPLTGWYTKLEGHVFNDLNENGKMDPGEPGLAGYPVVLKKRENSVMDRGAVLVTTDQSGYYVMDNAYPLMEWIVVEAYTDQYFTTGVTFQADNQPNETTVLGAGVDVGFLPIIGLSGRLDWGVKAYVAGTNGGIVGTVSYDTTRNEFDPRYAAVEDWQPGIPDMTVNLWATVACGTTAAPCDPNGWYELAPDGSYAKGALLNTLTTETWARPKNCTARDVDGAPLLYPADQQVLPPSTGDYDCLEGVLMGLQFETGFATLDGNYGFGDGCFGAGGMDPGTGLCVTGSPTPLVPADYLVEVVSPNDAVGKPLYQVTREEDINVGDGDQFVPQVLPPLCAGPMHTVDVLGVGTDGPGAVTNPTFAGAGGSPFEGMQKPLCNMKLVTVSDGRSIAPTFNYFTDVPLPGRFFGLLVDDLNFSADPRSMLYGDKAGIPNGPVGVYDYTNRLVTTVESDFSGIFEVLLPSTNRISCPTPSGVCANVYRLVGNDPGTPGHLNLNYKPQFRTIAAEFEVYAGLLVPADLAPTQVGVTVQLPGGQFNQVVCLPDPQAPQLFAVSKPYVAFEGNDAARTFTLNGLHFGATQGTGQVTLDGMALDVLGWSDTLLTVRVPAGPTGIPGGPHQLQVTNDSGKGLVNGLTFHVLRTTGSPDQQYNPSMYEAGPGHPYATIQAALDAASANPANDLVVVYPGTPSTGNPRLNPRGAYYENLLVSSPVKLQGVGPGGFQGATYVPGSIIDGGAFGGDTALAEAWRVKIAGLTWDGNQTISDGAVIYLLASIGEFGGAFNASIDGFDLRGGDQQGFPTNINTIGGGPTGLPPNALTQGGAIFANAYVQNLQITNNVVQNNGGAYGTIRIGTPDLLPDPNNHNENLRIANNRIIANGGTNLAGGIGIFAGADNYEVAGNDICGNFSAEYGGGLSVFGYSPNGKIHDNHVYFNASYDEGGGIMIAGQLPANPGTLSPGSGPVDIFNNFIQGNLANDDGGGLRFLMAGNFPMNVYNNVITNNVSTHEGGGIGINDSPDVRVFNNTIMKNMTTATAVTSNGSPAPAGLSTSANSQLLQATLPGGSPTFSSPLLFNNIFWDNRSGTRSGAAVTGLGLAGDPSPIHNWDAGAADFSGLLAPTNSVLQELAGTIPHASNVSADPTVVSPYDTSVAFSVWRTNPNFVAAFLVAIEAPANQLGNYHLQPGSPAADIGANAKAGVSAPALDIDQNVRPFGPAFDAGADEVTALAAGLLRVTTSPAVPSQIEVDGLPMDDWALNWVKMLPGSYTVSYADLPGFTTPAPQAVNVVGGQVASLQGNFTQRGNLRVVTSPPVPSTITVDGVPSNDWGVWTDLPVASYLVCFGAVEGFDTPPCQTANLSASVTTVITGSFSANASAPAPAAGFGLLRVQTSPAVPSQIIVDGVPRTDWGLDWVKLAPGTYTVSFTDVPNFSTPPAQVVTVTAGATTTVTGNFIQRGWLRVVTSPAVPGTISVDGFPRNDWGMWTSFEPGSYQVCFGNVAGFTGTPACQTANVTAGLLTSITGTYTP